LEKNSFLSYNLGSFFVYWCHSVLGAQIKKCILKVCENTFFQIFSHKKENCLSKRLALEEGPQENYQKRVSKKN
jgi:hypothetical protein